MLRIVGAGVGRTGTNSLKVALATLLGAPCYHMLEVFEHPEHVPLWHAAAHGRLDSWDRILDGYAAAVDWPASAFWRELSAAYPDALVLLSVRESAEEWWRSASATIFQRLSGEAGPAQAEWPAMVRDVVTREFVPDVAHLRNPAAAMAAYDRHNSSVRAEVPSSRLVEWRPRDGWEPLCAALGVPVPAVPFPHTNTTAEFQARMRADWPPVR